MPSFATTSEVQTRAGRDLTDREEGTVDLLLEAVADEILDALGKDEDWYDALDVTDDAQIIRTLQFVSIEAVYRVLAGRDGLESLQESLGSYSYSQRFRESASAAGLYLTDAEGRRVRRAVFGSNVASAPLGSIFRESDS